MAGAGGQQERHAGGGEGRTGGSEGQAQCPAVASAAAAGRRRWQPRVPPHPRPAPQIKQQWRRLCKQHHPDLQVGHAPGLAACSMRVCRRQLCLHFASSPRSAPSARTPLAPCPDRSRLTCGTRRRRISKRSAARTEPSLPVSEKKKRRVDKCACRPGAASPAGCAHRAACALLRRLPAGGSSLAAYADFTAAQAAAARAGHPYAAGYRTGALPPS